MTNDHDVAPPAADALPTIAAAATKSDKPDETPRYVGKRRKSSQLVRKGPEMSPKVAIRHGAVAGPEEETNARKGLPVTAGAGATIPYARRKYGDWQRAAALFARGYTPVEVAAILGVPLPKVMRNLRESRRLRRWIAGHLAGLRATQAGGPLTRSGKGQGEPRVRPPAGPLWRANRPDGASTCGARRRREHDALTITKTRPRFPTVLPRSWGIPGSRPGHANAVGAAVAPDRHGMVPGGAIDSFGRPRL